MVLLLVAIAMSLEAILLERGSPLLEDEAWAILSQCLAACQLCPDAQLARLALVPSAIILNDSGHIHFDSSDPGPSDGRSAMFLAPERQQLGPHPSRHTLEQSHVYSLGMALFYGMDYNLPETVHPAVSQKLESLLAGMSEEDPRDRTLCVPSPSPLALTRVPRPRVSPACLAIWRLCRPPTRVSGPPDCCSLWRVCSTTHPPVRTLPCPLPGPMMSGASSVCTACNLTYCRMHTR